MKRGRAKEKRGKDGETRRKGESEREGEREGWREEKDRVREREGEREGWSVSGLPD